MSEQTGLHAVRIVHHGGPARNATVYINGVEATTATRAEIVLSDLYGQLMIGHTYTLEVRGYRIPWMSEYPNILRVVSGMR